MLRGADQRISFSLPTSLRRDSRQRDLCALVHRPSGESPRPLCRQRGASLNYFCLPPSIHCSESLYPSRIGLVPRRDIAQRRKGRNREHGPLLNFGPTSCATGEECRKTARRPGRRSSLHPPKLSSLASQPPPLTPCVMSAPLIRSLRSPAVVRATTSRAVNPVRR